MAKISVIVPVYKVEKYLERCLNSIVSQTLDDIEIILVDDGSPDNCPEMCDGWAKRDNRIRVIHKENQGLGYARNSGLAAATGEFISFVDSDDYIEPDMLEVMYNTATEHNCQMVMSGYKAIGGVVFSEGDILYELFDKITVFEGKAGIDLLLKCVAGAPPGEYEDSKYGFSCWKSIYNTRVIRENNLAFLSEREVVSEDALFVLDFISNAECVVGIPGTYYNYCRNEYSLSKSYRRDRFIKLSVLISEINGRLAKRMREEEYKIYTDRLLQAYARVALVQEIMYCRENNISKRELFKRLREICADRELQRILAYYPIGKLPKKQAIFAYAMKYSLVSLQILLVRLRKKGGV